MVVLILADVGPTPPAGALSATSSVDSRLRLDWEVGSRHGGRPVIQGYVYNDYLRSAAEVRLQVETLDASGTVTSRQVGFVPGIIPLRDRAYIRAYIIEMDSLARGVGVACARSGRGSGNR